MQNEFTTYLSTNSNDIVSIVSLEKIGVVNTERSKGEERLREPMRIALGDRKVAANWRSWLGKCRRGPSL